VRHQPAVGTAVGVELLDGEEPALGERRVQRRRRVALAEDEVVAVRPARLVGPHPQHLAVQRDEDVHSGQRTTDVCADRARAHREDVLPHGERGPV
jgi:hypothetical protein